MATIKRKPDFKKDYYEMLAWSNNHVIMGVDEVGRGCLAGPVVAAAVIIHPHKKSRLIKDSKALTSEELLKSYAWIIKHSWNATAVVHNRIIDRVNIYQATLVAMRRCVTQLFATIPQQPSIIAVDAMPLIIDTFTGDIVHFIYGESKSSSIAAASIVAKVTRDAIMRQIEKSFPGYLLAQHKGYSTPTHKQQIRERGATILHRTSFIDHLDFYPENQENQESLFIPTISEDQISL